MLRKVRIALAALFFLSITWLFLDFTGTAQQWVGWMAKIQFLPAVLALNVGVIIGLLALTLALGRVYCSVICPLGVMQDIFAWFGRKAKKNRYNYSPAKSWIRYAVLAVFIVLIVLGIGSAVALLAPYSAFGRICQTLLQPLWIWGNNLLAMIAEKADSYAFYREEVWMRSWPVAIVAIVTLVALFILAWRNGRTYCNTICPVGTVLGFVSRFSLLKPVIDTSKCNGCKLCARNCKAACINPEKHEIDYSRCVDCMDCINKCRQGAIRYTVALPKKKAKTEATPASETPANQDRRAFILTSSAVLATAAVESQAKKVDGGLAVIAEKKVPRRHTKIVPPGSLSIKNLEDHCTGCQLCVSECPNGVLRPSGGIVTFMQPEASYERGYCRPECTRCADVCPTGAIRPITKEEKTAIQVGHAVWIRCNCIPLHSDDPCGACARHCPTGAIQMVPLTHKGKEVMAPAVNEELCIGCGACENLCPARPFSAIYVEGHEVHREI